MRSVCTCLGGLLALLFALGCQEGSNAQEASGAPPAFATQIPERARNALTDAESFELLSIDPERERRPPDGYFHGFKVLGRTKVEGAVFRARLASALEKGVAERHDAPAKCFNPRHAIRATRGGKTYDFLICFECFQVRVLESENGSVDHPDAKFLTSGSPQPEFDQALRDAGLPLAKE